MSKKFLAGFIVFLSFSFAFAGKGEGTLTAPISSFSDTADKKDDSISQASKPVNDPKKDFKDLFASNLSTNTVNYLQLNPLAVSFVEDYMEKFGETVEGISEKGKPYLNMIETILIQHGLPKELKYLAVIESNLKSSACSWAGAVGPWQFMPETARTMGLKVNKNYDERRDFYKSTYAASKYLNSLYAIYNDWLLVIAAYNCGAGKVNSAIKKSGSKDFWTLQRFLPVESKNHVKKFIATHYILEGGHGGVTTATREETKNFIAASILTAEDSATSKTQPVTGRYNSMVIVKHLTMDIIVFNRLNPDFDKLIATNGGYPLRLPNDKMDLFLSKKPAILNESMQLLLNPGNNTGETSRL